MSPFCLQKPRHPSLSLTSEVLDEVLQLHLPLRLDVGRVHVSVEEDDGERQDEDGVGVTELSYHPGVTDTVPLAGERTRSCIIQTQM